MSLAAEGDNPTQVAGELFFNKIGVELYVKTNGKDYELFHRTGWDLTTNQQWLNFSTADLNFNAPATSVPVPAALWFLVSGLSLIGAARCKLN